MGRGHVGEMTSTGRYEDAIIIALGKAKDSGLTFSFSFPRCRFSGLLFRGSEILALLPGWTDFPSDDLSRLAESLQSSPNQARGNANAASGMAVHDECKLKFLELKAKRTYRFIIYKIEEKLKQVVVEEDFIATLPTDECGYAIFDYDFVTEENCQKSKIFFIAWSPDTSRVRSKMIYASSKDRFKRELDGIQVELQATDPTEMGLDVFKGRAN
ncbi:hypothetical protein HPP92_018053 [Vanilla planifolia]|uniref:ADF-H domain-containing protein n=1 Tax=Vanilla planifolia TaxID=51239 RepID=A0A835QCR7_VANPL|nr:hypothetical protein HPP92_018053 [Vanilla planifolia]